MIHWFAYVALAVFASVPAAAQETPREPVTIVLDPGHGGRDSGAFQGGVKEADLMLLLAREIAAGLERIEGMVPLLTRTEDHFVPLEARMSVARAAGADLLISLHADALSGEQAQGATVYTLTGEGLARAADRMVARHGSDDLVSGLDLTGQGDGIATVLMDLAQAETAPQSRRFADIAVAQMQAKSVPLNARPRRAGLFAVLNAPDFASVLIEVGFLSDADDRQRLSTTEGRAPIVAALTTALQIWVQEEAALAGQVRQ